MKQPRKLSKKARELLEMLECHLQSCSDLSPNVVANGIVCLLAGSLSLESELHDSFFNAGYVSDRKQLMQFEKLHGPIIGDSRSRNSTPLIEKLPKKRS
jgi:hypothetical protein